MTRKLKVSNRHYQIQGIKDVQHKNVNVTWDYWKFPRHPVAATKFKMRGRNTLILHYHYRVYPELGKLILILVGFNGHVHPVFINLIKIGYQLLLHNLNQVLPMLKFVILKYYNDWTIMELLDNKISQV